MKLEDFKIGEFFWTGSGKWKCFDIGSKTIIAIKWEKTVKTYTISHNGVSRQEQREIDPEQTMWYDMGMTNFYNFDFGGCWATQAEYKEIMDANDLQ